ncbi:MAG: DUF1223 domain-containing protein [Gammaproteobacteria bacterium]|nr:DUF1223 domain-containing protein [Gammaproteobacteria bacterium]
MRKITVVFFFILSLSAFAGNLHVESGSKKNTLIELYTSEGCSSCPPAEEYLNMYKNNSELWKTWIPVAFHVDYWDYIGWKDRYAEKKYGQRQSRYAKLKHVSTVYTPAFMVNGQNWRTGFFSRELKESNIDVGNLSLNIENGLINANFKSLKKIASALKLNVALLGMDLSTYIERGENSGRSAKHEFVVVGFSSKQSNNSNWKIPLPKKHYHGAKKYGLAVWVSEGNDPTPVQATGMFLPSYNE